MVAISHAIVEEDAVVVESIYAPVAEVAVSGGLRTEILAVDAYEAEL